MNIYIYIYTYIAVCVLLLPRFFEPWKSDVGDPRQVSLVNIWTYVYYLPSKQIQTKEEPPGFGVIPDLSTFLGLHA